MTTRRPQDPRTKRIPDEEAAVPTLSPGGARLRMPDPGATVLPDAEETVLPDPGATVMPVDERQVETVDPGATVAPEGLEPPKPRAQRGGGAVRGGAATVVDRTVTADSLEAVRQQVRAKAEAEARAGGKGKRHGAGWGTWVVAFLLLGGVGFGGAWLVMNPPGGGEEGVASATPAEDAKTGGGDDAGGEDGAAAAQDTAKAEDVAEHGETAAAAATDAASGAVSDAGAEAAASDTAEASDVAAQLEVTNDAAAPQADAPAATADAAAAPADTAPSPTPDAATPTTSDTALAVVDAQAAEVAPAPKPFIANPIEAARLNEDGLARRKAGDNAGAMRFYEMALAADPDHVWSRYNYACELALAGRDKEALAELTKLYKLGTADARRALQAARKDSDFRSIKDNGQFFRLTNF